ncbi:MAG TPA: helix-turn-helix transcriptional regulator [Candidatus Merdenecus merdavium]|nr:helix-turn-helix transcriptional regulator [Candidatus Merdenecus merdavium]
MDFGTKLKELRSQTGLTQKQLAEQIGITKSVISFYELRERTPSPEILVKLAAVFHVSTDYLLGIEKKLSLDMSGLEDDDIAVVKMMVDTLRKKNKSRIK